MPFLGKTGPFWLGALVVGLTFRVCPGAWASSVERAWQYELKGKLTESYLNYLLALSRRSQVDLATEGLRRLTLRLGVEEVLATLTQLKRQKNLPIPRVLERTALAIAREQVEHLLLTEPCSGPLRRERAELEWWTGRQAEALEQFHRAVECEPREPSHQVRYGQALSEAGQWRRAVQVWQKLYHEFPDYEPALGALVRDYRSRHAYDKLLELLHTHVARFPDDRRAWHEYALLLKEFGYSHLASAALHRAQR